MATNGTDKKLLLVQQEESEPSAADFFIANMKMLAWVSTGLILALVVCYWLRKLVQKMKRQIDIVIRAEPSDTISIAAAPAAAVAVAVELSVSRDKRSKLDPLRWIEMAGQFNDITKREEQFSRIHVAEEQQIERPPFNIIPSCRVAVGKSIGYGSFSDIFIAVLKDKLSRSSAQDDCLLLQRAFAAHLNKVELLEQQQQFSQIVAVKKLIPARNKDDDVLRIFMREAENMSEISRHESHPNILNFIGVSFGNFFYFVSHATMSVGLIVISIILIKRIVRIAIVGPRVHALRRFAPLFDFILRF